MARVVLLLLVGCAVRTAPVRQGNRVEPNTADLDLTSRRVLPEWAASSLFQGRSPLNLSGLRLLDPEYPIVFDEEHALAEAIRSHEDLRICWPAASYGRFDEQARQCVRSELGIEIEGFTLVYRRDIGPELYVIRSARLVEGTGAHVREDCYAPPPSPPPPPIRRPPPPILFRR